MGIDKIDTIEIINWNDLVDQFGIVDEGNGLKTATQILTELSKQAIEKEVPEYIFIDCNKNSDAFCTFYLVSTNEDGWVKYEYQGTAN